MKLFKCFHHSLDNCRSLRGERGLKRKISHHIFHAKKKSFPTRGTWIETLNEMLGKLTKARRSLRGERGLKLVKSRIIISTPLSFPTRGTWIETLPLATSCITLASFPTRGTWIETLPTYAPFLADSSFPTRGTWIETNFVIINGNSF